LAAATFPALADDAALWLADGTAADLPGVCVETDFAGALRVAGTAADATGTAFEIPETDIMGTFF
jgi:hypothetical protein